MKPDANTTVYCIIGNPVRHSLSPVMHNAAFEHLHINAIYVAFQPQSAQKAIEAMKTLGIQGASVTIPFKVELISLCDEVDDLALEIGSVNTLINVNGNIKGYNTDGNGLIKALEHHAVDYVHKNVLIIGNGGSARAIAYTLAHNNAHITICGRNENNVIHLVHDLQHHGISVNSCLLHDLHPDTTLPFDIIINTTPVGMIPHADTCPINEHYIHPHHIIVDIIYSPRETMLIKTARNKGCKTITGEYMLLYQACMQFELWTGKPAPFEIMYNALTQALQ